MLQRYLRNTTGDHFDPPGHLRDNTGRDDKKYSASMLVDQKFLYYI